MQQQIVTIHKRFPCNHCLKTLNPLDPDLRLRTFVRCSSCGYITHQSCYAKSGICPVCNSTNLYGVNLVGSVPSLEMPTRFGLDFAQNQSVHLHSNILTKPVVFGAVLLALVTCLSLTVVLISIALIVIISPRSEVISLVVPFTSESDFPTASLLPEVLLATENFPTVIAFAPIMSTLAPTLTPFPTTTFTLSSTPSLSATATMAHVPTTTNAPKATMTLIPLSTSTSIPIQTLRATDQSAFTSNLTSWMRRGDGGVWFNTREGLSGMVDNHTDGFYVASNSYTNFLYEATFVIADGHSAASAGLVFRSQSDPLQGCYMVRVSVYNGGQISLVKFFPIRQYQQLDIYNLPIRLNAQYTIQIIAIDTEITVYLNGERVLHSYDNTYDEGVVGLNINSSTTLFYSAIAQQN